MLQTTTHDNLPTNACTRDETRTGRIRELNDQFRTGMQQQIQHLGCRLVTAGVWELGPVACFEIMLRVRGFNEFCKDNDLWHERWTWLTGFCRVGLWVSSGANGGTACIGLMMSEQVPRRPVSLAQFTLL